MLEVPPHSQLIGQRRVTTQEPQWGRSVQIPQPSGESNVGVVTEARLVSVRLERPQDITLYLWPQTVNGQRWDREAYRLAWGSGGISQTTLIESSCRGTVMHVSAQSIDVDVYHSSDGSGRTAQAAAAAGLGRPVPQWVSWSPDLGSLPAWSVSVRIIGAGGPAATVTPQHVFDGSPMVQWREGADAYLAERAIPREADGFDVAPTNDGDVLTGAFEWQVLVIS